MTHPFPRSVDDILDIYDPKSPLSEAWTIPASPWYVDPRILDLEQHTVFAKTWQLVGREEQVRTQVQFVTWELAGEPIVVVRGNDGVLRGFLQRLPGIMPRRS